MCGINGFIKLKNNSSYTSLRMKSVVHSMNERIIHRGPDSEGLYADDCCSLGMRRLSVIDLNTGSQPVFNIKRDRMIIFNGEIYNYRELRDELIKAGCKFQTKSDTEVVLLGIEKYGKEFIKRLEGMFAFCIYDTVRKSWLLARDRAGEKPLYYCKTDEFMIFSSELKSIMAAGLIPKELDYDALTAYFQLTYIPAPMCILKGVRKLMPASMLEIASSGEIKSGTYWRLDASEDKYCNYDFCKTRLRQALFNSVEHRMIADVPLGAFLSGGFDSSVIVGIMSEISDRAVDTFTVGFKEKSYDESRLASIVAKKNGTNHHAVMLDWDEAVKDIERILENMDEPFADPSFIASYAVARMTRDYVAVALTGDAGDELFAGYNKYLMGYYGGKYKRVPRILRRGLIEPLAGHLPGNTSLCRKVNKVIVNAEIPVELQAKRLMSRAFGYKEARSLLSSGIKVNRLNFIKKQFDELPAADDQKRIQFVDFHTVLEGQMLFKTDRSGMLASLETRVPMLDTDVVELAFHMPSSFKISKKEQKIILKDTFRDMLPDELFHASKHGFDVPVGVWMDGALKSRLKKYSSREFIVKQGFFNKEFIDSLMAEKKILDIGWSTKLWSFFVFQSWYERYMIEGV